MENKEIKTTSKNNSKKIVGGALLLVGAVLLAKQFGMWFPTWLISWPMLLIVIGLANGFKHRFKNSSWLIVTLIGALFLLEKINPDLSVAKYTWPLILIGIGIWFLFGRKNNKNPLNTKERFQNDFGSFNQDEAVEGQTPKNDIPLGNKNQASVDEYLDSVAVFGGSKRSVFSKNFKGGEITSIFGGSDINFSHADINGTVILETTQIFGGTKIIVPPTWDVVTEISPIFGGVDDNRSLHQVLTDKSKVLIIRGTTVFGGIEIRNF